MKSVAVIGGGISGLVAAIELSNAGARVVLYEKEEYLGGAFATPINSTGQSGIDIDLNFMVFNPATFPNVLEVFEKIGVDIEESSVSLDKGDGYEWGTRNGFSSLLSQKSNTMNPYFWKMLRDISKFKDDSLGNEMFALFLDETMSYTCSVFKSDGEDLKVAQLRKISLLIEKARIEKEHEVLEFGCGWGNFAIEVVKQTGCKYTGISLSEEQMRFAESRVKEAGLQDRIRFLLCDYRELPSTSKYDRIIACGMLEHVGHEYIDEFFGVCESLLAEDGLLVLQFISCPDSEYDEYRLSAGFMKEYIFPGGCLPSLSRVTSGMASSSRLCVEHLENIGIHYLQTLRCWRKNFLEHESKIKGMGFDEKFIRTWEYYFDYCAAGFKSRMLGDYQIVFSRPGNLSALSDPYKGFPSAN